MLIASTVTVDGAAVRFSNWQYGYGAGSPFPTWSVDPLEAATEFAPSSDSMKRPVVIKASIDGTEFPLVEDAWIDAVEDGVTDRGRVNRIHGRDQAYKLFERGPVRETIFVPRNIIEEIYPRGVRIFTLNGESVIGIPPEAEPRFRSSFKSTIGVKKNVLNDPRFGTVTIDPDTGSGKRRGPITTQVVYDTVDAEEFALPGSDDCIEDYRRGPIEEWVESVPPLIVLFGDKGLGSGGKTFTGLGAQSIVVDTSDLTGQKRGVPASLSRFKSGGVNAASLNFLVKLVALKAGFARLRLNTPDMGMFEPVQVGAGATWYSIIQTLVGPWNPMIFVSREPKTGGGFEDVLNVFDIEAADISTPRIIIGPESASVIRKSISRIPPYKSLDILGTLRRAIHRRSPDGAAGLARDVENDTPHIGPHTELPYTLEYTDTYRPSDFATAPIFPGEDAVDWTQITSRKRYYVDPESAQVSLVESEDQVFAVGGMVSRRLFKIDQHTFDDVPHGHTEEEYGIVIGAGPSGGQSGSGLHLLRRVTTRFDDQAEVEGVWAQHNLVEGLVCFSRATDGQNYKAIPYWDAAASGTIDISASSIDSIQFAKIQESREEYQMLDSHVARKRTWVVDYLGGRPPRFSDEVFAVRHRLYGGGYDPRQRFCFPIDEVDGEGTKSIAALFLATRKQAELIRDRAKRRGGQRHEELTVELNTFLPRLRIATAIRLEATPIRVLNAANNAMAAVNVISGDYWVAGFNYVMAGEQGGAARISTIVHLRSKW